MIQVTPNIENRIVEVQVNLPSSTSENSFSCVYSNNKLQSITYETGRVKTFTYSGDLLASISNAFEGSTILKVFNYDTEDRLIGVEVTYS